MLSLSLKYFENAAKTENFSKTAQHFGVPTSTVSASIKKLESTIDVPLFNRTTNKISLNESGKILLEAVEASQAAFKKARSEIDRRRKIPSGEIHLLILANRKKINDVIYAFKQMYPEVSFVIKHTLPESTSEIKNYDIIVAGDNIVSEHFNKTFWLKEDVLLAVNQNNPLSAKESVTTEEMQNQKFICMHKGSSIRNYMDTFFTQKGIKADTSIECEDPTYLSSYLEMNLGVALLPVIAMKGLIGKNIKLLKIDNGLHRDTYIYVNRNNTGLVDQFSKMLLES
jgi:DNA-binding transcriptional LysR family regulator